MAVVIFPTLPLQPATVRITGRTSTSKEAYSSGSLRQQMAYHGRFTKFHVKACHWRLTPAADRRRLLIPPRVALPSGLLGQALAESRMYIRGRRRYTRPVLVVANVERRRIANLSQRLFASLITKHSQEQASNVRQITRSTEALHLSDCLSLNSVINLAASAQSPLNDRHLASEFAGAH